VSNFQRHARCHECGSKDNVGVYDDGHGTCFSCGAYYHQYQEGEASQLPTEPQPSEASRAFGSKKANLSPLTPLTTVFRAIPRRGLTEESIKKYGIDINMDKSADVAHRYPYFRNGEHVANKVRKRSEKAFYWEGDSKDAGLFGQHLFPRGCADTITIVEGELDAPSGWQLFGGRYPVVAVPSVGHAVAAIRANYEYLNSFKGIVICFDVDEGTRLPNGTMFYPGQDTAKKVADLFAPNKCRILTLQHGKDLSEYLQKGIAAKTFVSEWWKAPHYSPAGLKIGADMWDEITNRPSSFAIPYPWEPLNKKTYGIRLSEAVLLMADTGVGKTSIFKEIEHAILTNEEVIEAGYGVGFLHLEEPNFDTALGIMSIESNRPYHLPDTPRDNEELRRAYDKTLNNNRAIFYDHFGSNNIDEILSKVRYMAVMGCKYIFIDHLSIIVSDQSGDERKQLDEISTKLKTLTMELNIAVFCVIHTNRDGQARGSAGPEKVANIHLSLHRDKKDPDPWRRNVLKIEIEKNRFSGRTGPTLWLFYDEATGRLVELDDVAITKYEEGLTINDSDLPF
jgi:twinkle protein